ncbi:hypothetical protein HYQ46_000199 [Verticillium longisporum]|nr:hypothetical protein HYQ46_000199 [Verticillium longisporum]
MCQRIHGRALQFLCHTIDLVDNDGFNLKTLFMNDGSSVHEPAGGLIRPLSLRGPDSAISSPWYRFRMLDSSTTLVAPMGAFFSPSTLESSIMTLNSNERMRRRMMGASVSHLIVSRP